MANIFKRTLLWRQVEEACAEYAALRRREYRHALKTKRMFIRLQVMAEVQRAQIQKVFVCQSFPDCCRVTLFRNDPWNIV
jgi:hypothetical protein